MTDENAERLMAGLAAREGLARTLGLRFVEGGPGRAVVEMTVGPEHLNFLGACHGAAIFAVADEAFGLAANSHGTVAIGIDAHTAFMNGAGPGDTLRAEAVEASRTRRTGVYRIEVTNGDRTVAVFTGTVHRRDETLETCSPPANP